VARASAADETLVDPAAKTKPAASVTISEIADQNFDFMLIFITRIRLFCRASSRGGTRILRAILTDGTPVPLHRLKATRRRDNLKQ